MRGAVVRFSLHPLRSLQERAYPGQKTAPEDPTRTAQEREAFPPSLLPSTGANTSRAARILWESSLTDEDIDRDA